MAEKNETRRLLNELLGDVKVGDINGMEIITALLQGMVAQKEGDRREIELLEKRQRATKLLTQILHDTLVEKKHNADTVIRVLGSISKQQKKREAFSSSELVVVNDPLTGTNKLKASKALAVVLSWHVDKESVEGKLVWGTSPLVDGKAASSTGEWGLAELGLSILNQSIVQDLHDPETFAESLAQLLQDLLEKKPFFLLDDVDYLRPDGGIEIKSSSMVRALREAGVIFFEPDPSEPEMVRHWEEEIPALANGLLMAIVSGQTTAAKLAKAGAYIAAVPATSLQELKERYSYPNGLATPAIPFKLHFPVEKKMSAAIVFGFLRPPHLNEDPCSSRIEYLVEQRSHDWGVDVQILPLIYDVYCRIKMRELSESVSEAEKPYYVAESFAGGGYMVYTTYGVCIDQGSDPTIPDPYYQASWGVVIPLS